MIRLTNNASKIKSGLIVNISPFSEYSLLHPQNAYNQNGINLYNNWHYRAVYNKPEFFQLAKLTKNFYEWHSSGISQTLAKKPFSTPRPLEDPIIGYYWDNRIISTEAFARRVVIPEYRDYLSRSVLYKRILNLYDNNIDITFSEIDSPEFTKTGFDKTSLSDIDNIDDLYWHYGLIPFDN